MLEQIEKTIYKVAIYIRLSKEDVDRGYDESESIKNQRMLLTEYVQKFRWKYQLIDTYIEFKALQEQTLIDQPFSE